MARSPYRLAFNRFGWAEIRWHTEHTPEPSIAASLYDLGAVPGIRYKPGWTAVELPQNTWELPAVDGLFARMGLEPKWPRRAGFDKFAFAATNLDDFYPWQRAAAEASFNGCGLYLADDMGLGKTRSAILSIDIQTGPEVPRLIIGPQFARAVWLNELLKSKTIEDESQFCAVRTRDHNHPSFRPDALWYFCHYEIAHAWASHFATMERSLGAAALDEVHRISNPRTARAKGAWLLAAKAPFKILLSGTPIENRIGELWQPLSILTGPRTWGSWWDFRRRYAGALHNGFGYADREPMNIPELRNRISRYYLRRTVDMPEIAAQLPKLRRERIETELDEKDRAAHADLSDGFAISELLDAMLMGRGGSRVFTVLGRLRALTSKIKLPTTVEFASSLIQQNEPVIVGCWTRATVERIADKLRDAQHAVQVIHGGIPQDERDTIVQWFQSGHFHAIVATLDSLREGVTLTRARHSVVHDLSWRPSDMLQWERRVARLGQTRPCVSTYSIATNSIDTIMARILVAKAEHIEQTLGIDAAADAMDEIDLTGIAGRQDIEDWARESLARMVHR